jgi:hypothetical protein
MLASANAPLNGKRKRTVAGSRPIVQVRVVIATHTYLIAGAPTACNNVDKTALLTTELILTAMQAME